MLKLYNTLKRKKQTFKPIKKNQVGLYACGPTVYWYAHIGNLRAYVFEDVLRRTLEHNSYKVKHIINITDVGHLTSDSDTGEDKMEKGAQRDKKNVWEIAQHYTNAFKQDLKKLNIKDPSSWTKATDYIPEQIDIIKKLEKKGYAYLIPDGVYFDSSKIKNYRELWGTEEVDLKAGARVEVVAGKRNIFDFALWKLTPPRTERQMEWDSPWGKGFPGWHTECVAMALKKLGIPFDIHCGGTDHIQIHHTNEIAQTKALYGKNHSKYWMHGEFLTFNGGKMSKSKGDILTLSYLEEKGFEPMSFRYLCLTAHYRSFLNFSWQSIESAQRSLDSLRKKIIEIKKEKNKTNQKAEKEFSKKFKELINNDLDTAKALALLWQVVKTKKISAKQKLSLIFEFDKILGLDLKKVKEVQVPIKIKKLAQERETYREKGNWTKADLFRKRIEKLGYQIEDTSQGFLIKKR
jgi:cysteinyl-tRNA synthetase